MLSVFCVSQIVTALGKTWHPEHFVCAHCQQELGMENFFERDAEAYCENDYHNLFSPRCAYCNGAILGVSSMKYLGINSSTRIDNRCVLPSNLIKRGINFITQ